MSFWKQILQPTAEPLKPNAARIEDLPPLLEISYNDYEADYESDNSLDLGSAEGNSLISLMQTEFCLK